MANANSGKIRGRTGSTQLSNYVLGLVVYTFDNLRSRGRIVANLINKIDIRFSENKSSTFHMVSIEAKNNNFAKVGNDIFYSNLEDGLVERLQVQSHASVGLSTYVIRMVLNETEQDPQVPNYFFLGISAEHAKQNWGDISESFYAIVKDAFDWLNGTYGYANVGYLVSINDADQGIPFATSLVDFRNLKTDYSVRDTISGIYWSNFLGRQQVGLLGGVEKIQKALPNVIISSISRGAIAITLDKNPFAGAGEIKPNVFSSFFRLTSSSMGSEKKTSTNRGDIFKHYRELGFERMKAHVRKFDEEYLKTGKLPRNYVWRPYRFCSQDVVLGLTVVRHSVDNNCLEVDVCMTTDVSEFEEGTGAKITTSFLLSEAYKCGGSLEIRFSENVEDGKVPASICMLAEKYGVSLQHIKEGRIIPSEARLFYLALSEFSDSLQKRIFSLYQEGRLSAERPCYTLYHGLWSRSQVEQIILGSTQPESILGGDSQPEQRHLYVNDLKHASSAVMGGVLDRKLAKRERNTGSEALDLEDDVRPLDIRFSPDYYAKIYSCPEEMPMPWVNGQSTENIASNNEVTVLLRVYNVEELPLLLGNDILLAGKISKGANSKPSSVYILVPRDFEELSQKIQDKFISDANKYKVGILICPETVMSLETDGARRLSSSRIMRE